MKRTFAGYRWEFVIAIMLVLAGVWATTLSPYYLNLEQLLFSSRNLVFTGIMTLGLALIILTGEWIFPCPPSWQSARYPVQGVPGGLALPLSPLPASLSLPLLIGAFNGFLVAKLRLPALPSRLERWAPTAAWLSSSVRCRIYGIQRHLQVAGHRHCGYFPASRHAARVDRLRRHLLGAYALHDIRKAMLRDWKQFRRGDIFRNQCRQDQNRDIHGGCPYRRAGRLDIHRTVRFIAR